MSMQKSAIYEYLKRLEICLEKGFPILPNYLIAVKIKEIETIVDTIYASLPTEVQEARALLRRREELQIEAQQKAEKIIVDAKNEKERMLSESTLLIEVQQQAEQIIAETKAECEKIKRQALEDAENFRIQAADDAMRTRENANEYVENLLSNLEQVLSQQQTIVKNGQMYMEKMKTDVDSNFDPLKNNYPQTAEGNFNGNFKID